MKKKKKIIVDVEINKDALWASSEQCQGLISQAKTISELIKEFKEGFEFHTGKKADDFEFIFEYDLS